MPIPRLAIPGGSQDNSAVWQPANNGRNLSSCRATRVQRHNLPRNRLRGQRAAQACDQECRAIREPHSRPPLPKVYKGFEKGTAISNGNGVAVADDELAQEALKVVGVQYRAWSHFARQGRVPIQSMASSSPYPNFPPGRPPPPSSQVASQPERRTPLSSSRGAPCPGRVVGKLPSKPLV